MMRRAPTIFAWLVLVVCVVAIAVAHVLALIGTGQANGSWVVTASFLTYPTVGALIISRRPKNAVGWVFCAIGLGAASTSFSAGYVSYSIAKHTDTQLATGLIDMLGNAVWPLNLGLGSLLLFLFPDGKLPSRRWRTALWVDVACISAMIVAGLLHAGPLEKHGRVINPIGIGSAMSLLSAIQNLAQTLFVFATLAAIVSVVVRYRHATGVQRQQIKWFAYGGVLIAIIVAVTMILADTLTPRGQDPSTTAFSNIGFALGFTMLPLGAGIGVLRYRLYDIDILINRTLVYGSLTAVLAVVYFGLVFVAQSLTQAVTGQTKPQPAIIVASTLFIATLFNPLRRRIQAAIDRRFYRAKYDAARTLEAFAASLRNQVELAELSAHLLGVVRETMQPAHVSLWLRPDERKRSST